jgi:Activator of Hsp90 ATPase homolog 1-like protein
MNDQNYTTTITVDASPADTYNAINDVRAWWGRDVEGPTDVLGAEFTFRGMDQHRSLITVTELVPGERVVWHVGDTRMVFVEDQTEWVDTTIRFDISPTEEGSLIRFSHVGLLPEHECYDVCAPAWTFFIVDSLRALINSGAGEPMAVHPARIA